MLSKKNGRQLFTYVPDYVVFDVLFMNTTAVTKDIIEIAAMKIKSGVVVGEYSTFVNPGKRIPIEISNLTGITESTLKDSPDFETALEDFLYFAVNSVLVGYNIDFNEINRYSRNYWGTVIGNDYVDILSLAKMYYPEWDSHSLFKIAFHYNMNIYAAHSAINNCKMIYKSYEGLKNDIYNPSPAARRIKRCPRCGNWLNRKEGKYGPFYGCMSYPDCRYTENLNNES